MRYAYVTLLLPLLGFGADAPPVGPRAIVGGRPAELDAYPFVVTINIGSSAFCTGTIISPNWVLTAAHCVVKGNGQTESILEVLHGQGASFERTKRTVHRAIPHPDYYYEGAGFRHDIALLEVSEPFPPAYSAALDIASLSTERLHALSGTLATALGYGSTENTGPSVGVRAVQIPLLLPEDCRTQLTFRYELAIAHDDTICAGSERYGVGAGDSGGPLIVPYNGDDGLLWLQVGVASIRGRNWSGATVVSVFTRVSHHATWIRDTIRVQDRLSLEQRKTYLMRSTVALLRENARKSRELKNALEQAQSERERLLDTLSGLTRPASGLDEE